MASAFDLRNSAAYIWQVIRFALSVMPNSIPYSGLSPLSLPPQSAKHESSAHAGAFFTIFHASKGGLSPLSLPLQSAKHERSAHSGAFFAIFLALKMGLSPLSLSPQSTKHESSAHSGDMIRLFLHKKPPRHFCRGGFVHSIRMDYLANA